MSSDMFTQYLHQNYMEFFDDMDDVVRYALCSQLMYTETRWLCLIKLITIKMNASY